MSGITTTTHPGNGITVGFETYNIILIGGTRPASVNTDVTINAPAGTSINADSNGMAIWTDGTGNDIVINAGGNITAGGAGILAHTGDTGNPAGAGSIEINHTGHIQTTGNAPGIAAWVGGGGTNSVTINNTGNATIEGAGDGIVIGDPVYVAALNTGGGTGITGISLGTLLPSSGTGTVTNASIIDVGGNGIVVNTTGAASVTNTVDGSITSGLDGIHIGGSTATVPTPIVGGATVLNSGEIDAGRHGIFVFGLGGGEITNDATGVIHAAGNGIQVGTSIAGVPTPSGGSFTILNEGEIGTSAAPIGGAGIQAFVSGDLGVTNSLTGTIVATDVGISATSLLGNVDVENEGSIEAGTGGISALALAGTVLVTSPGDVTTTDGTGVLALAAVGSSTVDTRDGTVTSTNGSGIVAGSLGGPVLIDSGEVSAGAGGVALPAPLDTLLPIPVPIGGGVVGISGAEGTTVNTHGNISVATGGVFGAAAISVGGSADLNLNGITIDPPLIGGASIVIGGVEDANIVTGAAIIDADLVGLLGVNTGTGDINIDAEGATVGATGTPLAGIVGVATGGGDVDIEAEESEVNAGLGIAGVALSGGSVYIDAGAVDATGLGLFSIGVLGVSTDANVDIDMHDDISADGIGIAAYAGGNLDIDFGRYNDIDSNSLGVLAFAGGDIDIAGRRGDVTSDGIAILAVSTGGSVSIDIDEVTSANGSGILAAALGGDVAIDIRDDLSANGLAGIGAGASGSIEIDLHRNDVTNTGGLGIAAIAGGDIDIDGRRSDVTSEGAGIFALSTGGNITIDIDEVTSANGSGILAAALGGDVSIDIRDDLWANGLAGIGAGAAGNIEIDLHRNDVTNTGGLGIAAVSVGGDVDIEGRRSDIESEGTGILAVALGGNVWVDIDEVTSANGSGVVAFATGGDAHIDAWGKITADNGLVGASAISVDGNATVNVHDDIDPPLVGANAITIGSGLALVNVADGVLVEADLVGVNAMNIGSGDVEVNVGEGATVESGAIGVAVTSIGSGTTTVNNDGTIQGNGILAPVILAITTSSDGVVINNSETGVIQGNQTALGSPLGPFEPLIVSLGGPAEINNDGAMHGSVTLVDFTGTGNVVNNTGFWETGGINALISSADDAINNTGSNALIEANLFTLFIVDDFTNSGGATLSTDDGGINDLTIITGNFNGAAAMGDSNLAFDARLTPNQFADLLVIGGDVTGTTLIHVNDLDAALPGEYTGEADAILFATVLGNTDVGDFVTDGGIDKGLFRYDAYLRETPTVPFIDEWVLASALDSEAFEFPVISYGAQNLWYASTGAWLDRTADLRSAFGVVDVAGEGNVTPGAWARVFGGALGRDVSNTVAPPDGLLGPTHVYEDRISQGYYGFLAGIDFGSESLTGTGDNQAWLVGVLGGYAGSELGFETSGTEVSYSQASVGAYATYLNGGFFLDAVGKVDFGTLNYSFDDGSGFTDTFDSAYTSLGVIIDTGYRFDVSNGWFFEPKATLSYVHTSIEEAAVLGTGIVFEDGESLRGRIGVRVGTVIESNGYIVEPYLEASLWNEFQGNYAATLSSNGNVLPVGYDAGGFFGELALGANIFSVGDGWNGFAEGAVQFDGSGYQSVSGNIGIRKSW